MRKTHGAASLSIPAGNPDRYLIKNTALITMDEQLPSQLDSAAILIQGGLIAAVFPNETHIPASLESTVALDVDGRTIIPGLTDGHAHLDRETLGDDLPGFGEARNAYDVVEILAAEVARTIPGKWIVTRPLGTPPAYDNAERPFGDLPLPTRHDLDRVSPQNPVFIRPIWGFWNIPAKKMAFANSRALELAKITGDTISPHPSLVIVKENWGQPTGLFIESSQQPIIEHTLFKSAPGFSLRQRSGAIARAFGRYASYGTTAVFEGHGVAAEVLEAYLDACGSDSTVPLRATLPLSPYRPGIVDLASVLRAWRERFQERTGGRAMVDGVYLEPDTDTALNRLRMGNNPRTGWAGFSSGAVINEDEIEASMLAHARAGVRVCSISPGLLPLMKRINGQAPISELRWTLGHQAVLSRKEIEIAAELGVMVTTVTGHHLRRGVYTRHLIGTEQENDVVPVKSLMEAGVPVVLGSDNQPISLWDSVVHVVSREDDRGTVVSPDQIISRYDALKLITIHGAALTGEEASRGIIRPGFDADFAVLDRNPLEGTLDELKGTRSIATFIAGRHIPTDGDSD